MKRLRLAALAGKLVVASVLAATALGGAAAPQPASVDYLSITQNTVWAELLQQMTNTYAKTVSGSTFKDTKIPQEQLNQKIQLLAGQDALPMLYNTPAVDAVASMQEAGQVADVGKEFQKLGVSNELVPARGLVQQEDLRGESHRRPEDL
jgi:raffinose/stachyose/melibiose transport system substrate-binding protein